MRTHEANHPRIKKPHSQACFVDSCLQLHQQVDRAQVVIIHQKLPDLANGLSCHLTGTLRAHLPFHGCLSEDKSNPLRRSIIMNASNQSSHTKLKLSCNCLLNASISKASSQFMKLLLIDVLEANIIHLSFT